MGNNPSVQVPNRESVSDLGSGLEYAEYVDLNYLKERDDATYRHFKDGKPDVFTHTLAVGIKVPANARYIPPSAQGGVGLVLQKTDADTYQVAAMVRNGPAHRSRRISKGDTLVQVNGQTFENHRARLDGPLSHLSGPAGSDVKLRFQTGNGEVRDVTLSRDTACFPDEIAFHVPHFGQKYQPTVEAAFDNSRHRISGYVPPPVKTTAPTHAQSVRASSPLPRSTGEYVAGFGADRNVVGLSPRSSHISTHLGPHHDDPALQPGFQGYGGKNVQMRAPLHISGISARDEMRVQRSRRVTPESPLDNLAASSISMNADVSASTLRTVHTSTSPRSTQPESSSPSPKTGGGVKLSSSLVRVVDGAKTVRISDNLSTVLVYSDQPMLQEEPGTTLVVDSSDPNRSLGSDASTDPQQLLRDGDAAASAEPNTDIGWPASVPRNMSQLYAQSLPDSGKSNEEPTLRAVT